LTDSELGVIRLAAEGLTNRQIGDRLFISRRTVGNHLAHVFQKLDINNRSQLPAEVARRQGQRQASMWHSRAAPNGDNIQVMVDARAATNR
jgi:DNA-binding CsgD family transcriptional regulator